MTKTLFLLNFFQFTVRKRCLGGHNSFSSKLQHENSRNPIEFGHKTNASFKISHNKFLQKNIDQKNFQKIEPIRSLFRILDRLSNSLAEFYIYFLKSLCNTQPNQLNWVSIQPFPCATCLFLELGVDTPLPPKNVLWKDFMENSHSDPAKVLSPSSTLLLDYSRPYCVTEVVDASEHNLLP